MARLKIAIPLPHSRDEIYCETALARFNASLQKYGVDVTVVPLTSKEAAIDVAMQSHGLLLPGSPADIDPLRYQAERGENVVETDYARDYVDEVLLENAFQSSKPILGVCHGLQALNVFAGGNLIQGIPNDQIEHAVSEGEKIAHMINVDPLVSNDKAQFPSLLNNLDIPVNSNHHQAVLTIGHGLRVFAKSGDGVIEGLIGATQDHFVLGVQWHPEGLGEGCLAKDAIFAMFANAVRCWELNN